MMAVETKFYRKRYRANVLHCLAIVALLELTACTKEEAVVFHKRVTTGTTDDLYRMDQAEDGSVTAIGGYVWSRGTEVACNADLSRITADSFCNKGQFDLLRTKEGMQITVGTDGYFFTRGKDKKSWTFHRLANWDILHHVIETPAGFVASGGKSYEKGYIFHINPSFSIDTVLYLEHEISEIIAMDSNTLLSVGWGTLQKSTDGGIRWQTLDLRGDFFASGHFLHPKKGIVIGYNGTVYHTSDGGATWAKRTLPGAGFDSFRKLRIPASGEYCITGTKGRLWRSADGGTTWYFTKLPTDADLYDIVKRNEGNYLVCGTGGYMALVQW